MEMVIGKSPLSARDIFKVQGKTVSNRQQQAALFKCRYKRKDMIQGGVAR